jgi:hypothetical protein
VQVLIAAAVIGLLTAYYFGLRAGGIAAGAAFLLFVGALVMPGRALAIYGLVAVGVVALLVAGPRYGRKGARTDMFRIIGRGTRVARDVLRKLW